MERDKLVAEWCRLVGKPGVSIQSELKPKGGRPKSGESEVARQLGLSQPDVHRAVKVASLAPEAQQAANGQPKACNCKQLVASGGNCWAPNGQLVRYSLPLARQIVSRKIK